MVSAWRHERRRGQADTPLTTAGIRVEFRFDA
jgi:hypothetical protein